MKKLFVSALAILGLVACAKDDVVSVQDNRSAIGFNTFVENATRVDPSITNDNIQEFSVWAYMNNEDGVVFNDELVSRSGDAWTYNNLQYWLVGNNYTFAAFAGNRADVTGLPEGVAMSNEGLGVINFTNVEGANDILFAAAVKENVTANPGLVNIQFDHLLSKIKFSFKNGFANTNTTVAVKDITMTAPKSGSVDLAVAAYDTPYAWTRGTEAVTLNFGHMNGGNRIAIAEGAKESDNQRLTIPTDATYEYTVNFTVEVYNGTVKGLERPMEVKLSGIEFVAGHAYNLVATINQENLNLNAIEFTVQVDEWDEQTINGGAVEDTVKFISTRDELQAALNAATGNTSIILGADIDGNVTLPELANATVAINGNGHEFKGCFFIDGNSLYEGGKTVFENIDFVTADASSLVGGAFIYCGEENGTEFRYPDSVVIKDCTFTATGAAVDAAVAAKFWSLNGNLVVEGCTANGLHSMLQLTSCGEANVAINDTTIENCKSGLSLQYCKTAINNTIIKTREYGIRVNGNNPANLIEVKGSTIEAKQPVIARKVTVAGLAISVDAATTLTTDELYQVVFTKGNDDAAYVAPTVDFAFNGPANLVVFPNNYATAATTDELKDAIENDYVSVVEVTEDLTYGSSVAVSIDKDVTINAEGYTISAGGASSLTPSVAVMGEYDVTLNDANIVGGFVGAYYGAYVEVNGGSLKFTDGKSGRNCFYAAGTDDNTSIIVINDVDVNMANASGNSYLCAHGNAIIYVNGGNFYGKPVGSSNAYVKEAAYGSYTGQVIITGGTFNFDPSEWVADGYVATKNGSVWTVSK